MEEGPIPTCCNYTKCFIVLSYGFYYPIEKDYFIKNKPFWTIRGAKMPHGKYIEFDQQYSIKFCPNCGKELPDIKLKDPIPEKVTTIVDGGYYCDTCYERLHACTCNIPETMWEIICLKE